MEAFCILHIKSLEIEYGMYVHIRSLFRNKKKSAELGRRF